MSRILMKIRNHKKKICLLLTLMVVFFYGVFKGNYYLSGVALIIILGLLTNFLAVKKMRSGVNVFCAGSKIRNIDSLIIGELCSLEGVVSTQENFFQIAAPERTLGSSYEILRHTFGILNEVCGEAVLVTKKGNVGSDFSIFDIPYFQLSPISVRRLRVEGLQKKSKLPLIFAPIRTIQILLSVGKNRKPRETDVPQEMYEFCRERNIRIRCLVVD